MIKESIYYHRSYRKESISRNSALIELVVLLLPVVAVFFMYPYITYYMGKITRFVLYRYFSAASTVQVIKSHFVFFDLYIVHMAAFYHTPMFYFVFFIVSFALLIMSLIIILNKASPIMLYVFYILSINAISATFFALVPLDFPYDINLFSDLYIKTEVAIWLVIPFVLAIALVPLRSNLFLKLLVTIATLLYSIAFSLVRYILFLYVLERFSYVFMASLFFAFGPLIDFIYIVGIYSYYLSAVSRKNINSDGKGQWLF